jgi:hypothetical protein
MTVVHYSQSKAESNSRRQMHFCLPLATVPVQTRLQQRQTSFAGERRCKIASSLSSKASAAGRREGARDRGEIVVAGPREGDKQLHGGGGREEPQPCRRRPEPLDAPSACAAPFLSPMRRGTLADGRGHDAPPPSLSPPVHLRRRAPTAGRERSTSMTEVGAPAVASSSSSKGGGRGGP